MASSASGSGGDLAICKVFLPDGSYKGLAVDRHMTVESFTRLCDSKFLGRPTEVGGPAWIVYEYRELGRVVQLLALEDHETVSEVTTGWPTQLHILLRGQQTEPVCRFVYGPQGAVVLSPEYFCMPTVVKLSKSGKPRWKARRRPRIGNNRKTKVMEFVGSCEPQEPSQSPTPPPPLIGDARARAVKAGGVVRLPRPIVEWLEDCGVRSLVSECGEGTRDVADLTGKAVVVVLGQNGGLPSNWDVLEGLPEGAEVVVVPEASADAESTKRTLQRSGRLLSLQTSETQMRDQIRGLCEERGSVFVCKVGDCSACPVSSRAEFLSALASSPDSEAVKKPDSQAPSISPSPPPPAALSPARVSSPSVAPSSSLLPAKSTPTTPGRKTDSPNSWLGAARAQSKTLDDVAKLQMPTPNSSFRARSHSSVNLCDSGRVATLLSSKPVNHDAVLIIDTGSSYVKAGIAGETVPRSVVQTIIGYSGDQCIVGSSAALTPDVGASCPVAPAEPVNWDRLQDVWECVISSELKVRAQDHRVLMTDLPDMSKGSREKMAEIMFECFSVPALHIASPAVLSLFSQGMTTGLVVDCGNRLQLVPVIDGFAIDPAIWRTRRGLGLTEHLGRLLSGGRGYDLLDSAGSFDALRKLKESSCYVAQDYESELLRPTGELEVTHTVKVGDREVTVTLGKERFQCPEAIFKPSLAGWEMPGLHESLFTCINACPMDYRKSLWGSVLLSGGSTLFRGLPERLHSELLGLSLQRKLNLRSSDVRVVASSARKYAAWAGASLLATLPAFDDRSVSCDTYFETGRFDPSD